MADIVKIKNAIKRLNECDGFGEINEALADFHKVCGPIEVMELIYAIENPVSKGEPAPLCPYCNGEGIVANSDEREPWSHWAALQPRLLRG